MNQVHASTKLTGDVHRLRSLSDFCRGEDFIVEIACGINLLAKRGTNFGPEYNSCESALRMGRVP